MGRLLFEKIPEQSATINDGSGTYWTCKYTYTDYNAVATKTDARGVVTTYSYDDLRRMTGVSYNVSGASGVASTPSVTYSYDTGSTSATKGLLLSVSIYNQSSESYSYDTDKRLSSLTRTIGTKSYATGYTYTTANQITQLTYPSNRAVNINHDSIGRLSSIVNNSDSANYLSSISYNPAGQTTGWTLGSNIAESLGYDSNRLQMTSQTVTQSGSTRLSLSYSYAASSGQMGGGSTAGNAGQLMSVSGSIGGQTESAAYTYDNVGRLVTSNQTSNGVSAQRRFVYDRWGNRTEVYDATSGGSQIQSVSLEQSGGIPTNRITSVTSGSTLNYTYDSAGNVTSDEVHSYTYDAENRVVSVDGGTTASYSYDHQNRRVKKTVGSTTTHYVWQGGQCIAEHNGSTGAMVNEYIFAGSRMIAREGGGRVFFLYDRLSARATITDGQGGIQGRQSHLPFGEELVATGTTDKHRFTSYERDGESGLDYAVNRGYSAGVGRFFQADPKASSARADAPQSRNRYTYALNEPVDQVDPLGLEPFPNPDNPFPDRHPNHPGGKNESPDRHSPCPAWQRECSGGGGLSIELIGDFGLPPNWIHRFLMALSGSVAVSSNCDNRVISLKEGHNSRSTWDPQPPGSRNNNVDAVATPKGMVKIPSGCKCQVFCDQGYKIECECLPVINEIAGWFSSDDTFPVVVPKSQWGRRFPDPTNPQANPHFSWVGSEGEYRRREEDMSGGGSEVPLWKYIFESL